MKISEDLLYYIWQFQYFKKNGLKTGKGESVTILHPGFRNENAGPDFSEAHVKIGNIEWIGNVEIHVRSSDWNLHEHDSDLKYENVVLHVVWDDDLFLQRKDGSEIPAIHIANRVSSAVLKKYHDLTQKPDLIVCADQWKKLNPLIIYSQFDRSLVERLNRKAKTILNILEFTHNDWEQTAYMTLANNFGFKVNNDPFSRLGKYLPLKMLLKYSDDLVHLETLIFGFAGFLTDKSMDDYHRNLTEEFRFLLKKFNLPQPLLSRHHWKFLRLRPSNFPSIRLAQFAALIHNVRKLFSLITNKSGFDKIIKKMSVVQSPYWINHYDFGKSSKKPIPALGQSSLHNIVINTVSPVLFAYGMYSDNDIWKEKAITYLTELKFENNKTTRNYLYFNPKKKTAYESQAMIELYQNYCLKKKCLNCNIGIALINPK